MDTEKINAVLTKAIVGMQEREIEGMAGEMDEAKTDQTTRIVRKIWLSVRDKVWTIRDAQVQYSDITGGDIERLVNLGIVVQKGRGKFVFTKKAQKYIGE